MLRSVRIATVGTILTTIFAAIGNFGSLADSAVGNFIASSSAPPPVAKVVGTLPPPPVADMGPAMGPDIGSDMETEAGRGIDDEAVIAAAADLMAGAWLHHIAPAAAPPPARTVVETTDTSGAQAWQRYAALPRAPVAGRPMIAVIIDDLGLSRPRSERVIALTRPLTLAFLPYGRHVRSLALRARAVGHELLVHMPMEPLALSKNPGRNALRVGLSDREMRKRLEWNLAQFTGYVGINNHMGSRFTRSPGGMKLVMALLRKRGMMFVDSLTTMDSVATATARQHGVTTVRRDVFLDHSPERQDILAQIQAVEARARSVGAAVAIGHPYATTLRVLEEWLPTLEERGFALVPVSTVAGRRIAG